MSSLNRIYFLRSSTVLFHITIAATGFSADFMFTSQLDVHRIGVGPTDWLHFITNQICCDRTQLM